MGRWRGVRKDQDRRDPVASEDRYCVSGQCGADAKAPVWRDRSGECGKQLSGVSVPPTHHNAPFENRPLHCETRFPRVTQLSGPRVVT